MLKIISDALAALAQRGLPQPATSVTHDKFLDYAERESRRTLDELRTAFNSHFERSMKVLTLLTGGAGAIAAYTINSWKNMDGVALIAIVTLAACWGCVAFYLAVHGMRRRNLDAGASLVAMSETYFKKAGSLSHQMSVEASSEAMVFLRMAELNREYVQTQDYAKAVSMQTWELRNAVVTASLSPLGALLIWGAGTLWR